MRAAQFAATALQSDRAVPLAGIADFLQSRDERLIPRCVECDALWLPGADLQRWRRYLDVDSERVFYCPIALNASSTKGSAIPYSALPEPMLAKSGPLPVRSDFVYEVKWDGFRAVLSTEGSFRVRSRRGWNMTERVGFLSQLPVRAVLDGELVALDADGKPDFPLICERMLQRRSTIPLTFMAFDVLSVEERPGWVAAVHEAPPDPRGHETRRAALADTRGVRCWRSALGRRL
jgi:hypothetical protein